MRCRVVANATRRSTPSYGHGVATDERDAVVAALFSYHAALEAGSAEEDVLDVLGPTLFMADEKSSGGPDRVSAHLFLTGDELAQWPRAFLDEAGPYQNVFVVVSVSIRGDAAVVSTRDTGSNGFRSWEDDDVTWFFGRSSGRWRIVGSVIRDIQLPADPER